jgi:hypothetical protein
MWQQLSQLSATHMNIYCEMWQQLSQTLSYIYEHFTAKCDNSSANSQLHIRTFYCEMWQHLSYIYRVRSSNLKLTVLSNSSQHSVLRAQICGSREGLNDVWPLHAITARYLCST